MLSCGITVISDAATLAGDPDMLKKVVSMYDVTEYVGMIRYVSPVCLPCMCTVCGALVPRRLPHVVLSRAYLIAL